MKNRSSRACIGAGYRLYTGNFRRIFRYSWPAATVYALVCSVAGTMMVYSPQILPLTLLLILIVDALFSAYGFAVLKQHQQTGIISSPLKWFNLDVPIFTRTLKGSLFMVLLFCQVAVIIAAITYGALLWLSTQTALVVVCLLGVIALVLLLPLSYVLMRYVLTSGSFFGQLSQRYPIGLRRWGFIFIVTFVAVLVEVVFSLILSLPASILSAANMQANLGVLNGDPYGMPSYIGWLTAVVFLFIGFIQAYVMLSTLFPLYYMYGAIDVQEKEKKEFNKRKI